MNQLQIKINNFTPAKVDFNYEQIEAFLNETLKNIKVQYLQKKLFKNVIKLLQN